MTNWLIAISAVVTSIATVVMSRTYIVIARLTEKNSQDDQRRQQEFSDLLQALVIARMTAFAGNAVSTGIAQFNQHYKGKTPIFPK